MNAPAVLLMILPVAWHHDDSPAARALAAQRIDEACKSIRIAVAMHTVEYFSGKGRLATGEYFECTAEIPPDDTHTGTDQPPKAAEENNE
jgi:hypothetical protein